MVFTYGDKVNVLRVTVVRYPALLRLIDKHLPAVVTSLTNIIDIPAVEASYEKRHFA